MQVHALCCCCGARRLRVQAWACLRDMAGPRPTWRCQQPRHMSRALTHMHPRATTSGQLECNAEQCAWSERAKCMRQPTFARPHLHLSLTRPTAVLPPAPHAPQPPHSDHHAPCGQRGLRRGRRMQNATWGPTDGSDGVLATRSFSNARRADDGHSNLPRASLLPGAWPGVSCVAALLFKS